jgi:hypothetical protein
MSRFALFGGRRRGVSGIGIILLIGLIGLIVFLRLLSNQEAQQRQKGLAMAYQDPHDMIQRFFIEQMKPHPADETGWKELLDFMSKDDQEWLETNRMLLAQMSQQAGGTVPSRASEDDLRYAALDYLIDLKPRPHQPTIVKVWDKGDTGAIFYHQPGHIESMQIVFIAREGSSWKIRRFFNRRDDYEMMKAIYEAHESSKTPLTGDELMFKDNPKSYPDKKHNELMAESGLTPDRVIPTPAPSPAPGQAATPEPQPTQP